eukprot:5979532-Alexandrium_andersonii.AAC.1
MSASLVGSEMCIRDRYWRFSWEGYPANWHSWLHSIDVAACVALEAMGTVRGLVALRAKGRPFSLGLPREVAWTEAERADFTAARLVCMTQSGAYLADGRRQARNSDRCDHHL